MSKKIKPEKKKTFVFDIDGVVTNEAEGYGTEVFRKKTPNKFMIKIINHLYRIGHRVILHTSRFQEDYDVTVEWLRKHRVKYHMLVLQKIMGDYYTDDKALRPSDWKNAWDYKESVLNEFLEDKK